MKKIIALAVLTASAATASAADNTWYAGADVGSTKFTVDSESRSRTGFGGFVGYRLNDNVAFEGSYRRLGSFSETIDGKKEGADLNALQISVLGIVPLSQEFALYGRLGYGRNSVEVTDAGVTVSASTSKALFGAGVSYQVDKAWGIRAEYSDLGNNKGLKARQFNIGATFAF